MRNSFANVFSFLKIFSLFPLPVNRLHELSNRAEKLRDGMYRSYFSKSSATASRHFAADQSLLFEEETVAFIVQPFTAGGHPLRKSENEAHSSWNRPFVEAELCVGTRHSIDSVLDDAERTRGKTLPFG